MSSGEIVLRDVPAPELRKGGILVRTAFSAISAGTERAQLETASKSIIGKAVARPDIARQVFTYARTNGLRAAYHKVNSRLETLKPLGYSCSGIVVGVGEGVSGFTRGDRVACAGVGYASHAEINWVPQNLAVRVPDNVSLDAAAISTIAAIAVQGLRQSHAALGETVVVIGVGLVGVLTVQLARSAGCRVVAIDLDSERAQHAVTLGAHLGLVSSDPELEEKVRAFSRYGADACIIAADTRSSEPIDLAARLLRDRGRIVIVGTVSMDAARTNFYRKEVSVVMSRSYGPGRYDPAYEEDGHDYPVGYVRWTEKRNMEAFLDMLSTGLLDISPLLRERSDLAQASRVLGNLQAAKNYTVILEYPSDDATTASLGPRLVAHLPRVGKVRIGCIGAGSCARAHIFPNLQRLDGVQLHSVASATGIAAAAAQEKYRFARACTSSELLETSDVNTVFVLSRNQTHSHYAVRALEAGKAVFVEKPLAVSREQLEEIRRAYHAAQNPFLMVGFNRRFAPATQSILEFFAERAEPMVISVRINAGYLPPDHWTQHRDEGGRIIGEMCHFVDWARFMVGHPIRTIHAAALPDSGRYNADNVAAMISFSDGSLADLLYLANGDRAVSKEYYEVFCQGKVARLDNFRMLELTSRGKSRKIKFPPDKGHEREVRAVLECIKYGKPSPIPFQEIIEVAETTFRIDEALRGTESAAMSPEEGVLARQPAAH